MAEVVEEWRAWRNGDYEVSNLGNVRRATPGRKTWPGLMLNLTKMKIGYYAVRPVVNGKNYPICVHRMVAEVFLGQPPEGATDVNHIDGVKTNNVVTNLEYVTHKENMRHARRTGLLKIGEQHGGNRFTEADVRGIRAAHESGQSICSLSRQHTCSTATIFNIVHRKTWSHI